VRILLVLTVVLALAASSAAAAAAPQATVPLATYVRQADRVCLDVAQRALALQREARRRVGAATSEAQALRIFGEIYRRQLALVRSMRRRLDAIGTPSTGAATARLLVDRFGPMLALGSLLGAVVGIVGYYLSFHLATASGATIVLLMTAVFLLAFVFAPSHGLLAHRLRHHPEHGASAPAIDPPPGHAHERAEGDVLASGPRSSTRR